MRFLVAVLFALILGGRWNTAVAGFADIVIPDTISVGLVEFGTCDSIDIPILNTGSEVAEVRAVRLGSGNPVFSFSNAFPLTTSHLDSSQPHIVRLLFCPEKLGCVADSLFVDIYFQVTESTRTYGIGLGACCGAPQLKIERQEIMFDDAAVGNCSFDILPLSNTGNFPLVISELRFGGNVFGVGPGQPENPFTISSGETRNLLLQFCPKQGGDAGDSVVAVSNSYLPIPSTRLRGHALVLRLGVETFFDVGEVPVGARRDTFLVLRNLDPVSAMTVLQVRRDPGEENRDFSIEEIPQPGGRTVGPGDTLHFHLSFHPSLVGRGVLPIVVADEQGLTAHVLLQGTGATTGIQLDTTYADAGNFCSLTARLEATGTIVPTVGRYRIILELPPFALFPKDVIPVNGTAGIVSYTRDGVLTIEGDNEELPLLDATLSQFDGRLLRITFRALSTGDSTNEVRIKSAEMEDAIPFALTGNGLVRIGGCDVGRSQPVSRKPLIRSVVPNPIRGETTITVRTPSGGRPSLRVYRIDGTHERTIVMPEGDGGDQTIPARFDDLLPGLYMLELSLGESRDVKTIIIEPHGE